MAGVGAAEVVGTVAVAEAEEAAARVAEGVGAAVVGAAKVVAGGEERAGTGGSGGKGGTGGPGGGGVPRGGIGQPFANPNFTQPRAIVPPFPESASTNQQVLYALAAGTGGFPIFNTNDLLTGLQKIAAEQNEYYLLGFAPSDSAEGSCHTLKVKVERGGTNVRARSGYCNVKPTDALAGKPIEKELEAHASAPSAVCRSRFPPGTVFLHRLQRSASESGDGSSAGFGEVQ